MNFVVGLCREVAVAYFRLTLEPESGFLPCTVLLKALLPKSKDLDDLAYCLIFVSQNFISEIYNFH